MGDVQLKRYFRSDGFMDWTPSIYGRRKLESTIFRYQALNEGVLRIPHRWYARFYRVPGRRIRRLRRPPCTSQNPYFRRGSGC